MDRIVCLPSHWFYVMCCAIIILLILAVLLSSLLFKTKSILYRRLGEPTESTLADVDSSGTFHIHFQNRKESNNLQCLYDNFKTDPSTSTITLNRSAYPVTTVTNEALSEIRNGTSVDILDEAKEKSSNNLMSSSHDASNDFKENSNKNNPHLPTLFQRQQIEKICSELLDAMKRREVSLMPTEAHELAELRRFSKKPLISTSKNRERSMSTSDLDTYDVVPSKAVPVSYLHDTEYTIPKNCDKVILQDDSGYLLPLSPKTSYINANIK